MSRYHLRRAAAFTFFAVLAFLSTVSAASDEPASQQAGVAVRGTPFTQREIVDPLGRTVTYYISHPRKPQAPILLMLQGSGCLRVLSVTPQGGVSTIFNLVSLAAEGDFTVVAVEKPYSGMMEKGKPPGSAEWCGAAFNEDFTAERWLVAIHAALDDARKSPWVDTRRTLVLGMSEGAVMSSLLASHDPGITDVIAIGGSGTTQLFDFIVLAYHHCFDSAECLADVQRNLADVQSDPQSATRFAWGHAYKRWTSFFNVDPGEEFVRSKARVYMAFGTADVNVPALSQEVAVAKLQAARHDITVRRVQDAGHSLTKPGDSDWSDLEKEYRRALAWFWERRE